MVQKTTQVSIVGGGPVGMALAIELGQRGVDVVVIEKEPNLHTIPKGQNLTQRTMEHFRTWGVEQRVREARLMPDGYPASGVNAYGHLLSEFSHPWYRRSEVSQYYFAANERLPQYLTERALRERVEHLPSVRVELGVAATEVSVDESGAEVATAHGTIRSDYVVGSDGSRSVVRTGIGIDEEIRDHDRMMVLLVFRSRRLAQLLEERFGPTAFFNVLRSDLDGYWRFLGTVDTTGQWFFHAPVARDTDRTNLDYRSLLHETVGTDFPIDLDYMGFWNLRIAIANDYRSGRGFIAGDSAHSHPPYGGYGINTGFEDARNLGWKLAAVIDGWAGDALLDSYATERRPVFQSTARDFIESFIERDRTFVAENEPIEDLAEFAEAWERRQTSGAKFGVSTYAPHYEGSPIVSGADGSMPGAVGVHEFAARPGHHLPPLETDPELFDRLGSGFALLTSDAHGHTVPRFRGAASNLGVPLEIIVENDMTPYETNAILVRPDHFISWVDDGTAADPATVLSISVGR